MPLVQLNNISDSTILALWKMEESPEELIAQSDLDEKSMQIIESFTLDKRRKEWLCVRLLIHRILGKYATIDYLENGKPFLSGENLAISISHSRDFAGVIICKQGEAGIDIEHIAPRIEKIKSKFLSDSEYKEIPQGADYIKQMLVYWCAKETMMKICGNKQIDFKKQIRVNPFLIKSSGTLKGEISENNKIQIIDLHFFEIDNNLIVWGCTANS